MADAGTIEYTLKFEDGKFKGDIEQARDAFKKLKGSVDDVDKGMGSAEKSTSGFLTTALSFGAGQAIFAGVSSAISAMKSVFTDSLTEFKEGEKSFSNLDTVVKQTNATFGRGLNTDALASWATDFQNKTGIADDAIIQSQAVLATFGNVSKGSFNEAIEASANLSQVMGTDLQSSTMLVGKALEDPIQGLSALKRVGVSFSDSQKEMIQNMVQTGDVAGAQAKVLEILKNNTGDAALAFGKTWEGQSNIFKESINGMKESLGGFLAGNILSPLLSLGNEMLPLLGNLFAPVGDAIGKVFDNIDLGAVAPKLISALAPIADAFASLFANPQFGEFISNIGNLLIDVFAGVTPIIGAVIQIFQGFLPVFNVLLPVLGAVAKLFGEGIGTVLKDFAPVIAGVVTGILAIVGAMRLWAVVQGILNVVMSANPIGLIAIAIGALVIGIIEAWKHSETFRNVVIGAWEAIKNASVVVFNFVKDLITDIWDNIRGVTMAVWNGIKTVLSVVWAVIKAQIMAGIAIFKGLMVVINALKPVFNMVFSAIKVAINILITQFKVGVAIVKAGVAVIKATITVLKTVFTVTFNAVKVIFNAFVTALKVGFTVIKTQVMVGVAVVRTAFNLLATIFKGIVAVVKAVVSAVASAFKGIVSAVSSVVGAVKGVVNTIIGVFKGLASSVSGAIGAFINTLKGIGAKVKGVFSDAGSWLVGAGKNILEGLAKGISKGAKIVTDILKGVVKKAINAVKSGFGIFSPSRVFQEIGEYVVEGFNVGINTFDSRTFDVFGVSADKKPSSVVNNNNSNKVVVVDGLNILSQEQLRKIGEKISKATAERKVLYNAGGVG